MNTYRLYLDWIDSQRDSILHRLKFWVETNTYSWNSKGISHFLELLKHDFKTLGGMSFEETLPSQKQLNARGKLRSKPLGKAFFVKKRPEAPIQVLLAGHTDTVYPPQHIFQKIEMIDSNIWKGPGIADMKGGIAVLLTALEAFERSPFAHHIGWEVILTPDEEIGSPGSTFIYEQAAKRHHVGLVFEPSFPDGAFVNERKGSATYTIILKGKAAHVGRDFYQGRSTVFALAKIVFQLENLINQDLIINVTDIQGKGPVNIVPDLACFRVNLRSSNADYLKRACEEVYRLAKKVESDGIFVEIIQDSLRLPKPFDASSELLFQAYASCAKDLDLPFEMRATGGVCDGNILAQAGLATIDTAGVIGGNLHTIEEYLLLSSLTERAKLMTLFLFKLANQDLHFSKKVPA